MHGKPPGRYRTKSMRMRWKPRWADAVRVTSNALPICNRMAWNGSWANCIAVFAGGHQGGGGQNVLLLSRDSNPALRWRCCETHYHKVHLKVFDPKSTAGFVVNSIGHLQRLFSLSNVVVGLSLLRGRCRLILIIYINGKRTSGDRGRRDRSNWHPFAGSELPSCDKYRNFTYIKAALICKGKIEKLVGQSNFDTYTVRTLWFVQNQAHI